MGSREARVTRVPWLSMLGWTGIAVLLVGAFFAALGTLNQTLYGASNFVERYLNAIADDEITAAAATPGVALSPDALAALGLPPNVSTAMLRSGVVADGPADVQIVSNEAHDDGSHTVVASYRLGESIEQTTFEVSPIEPLYGVLNRWRFAQSPLAVIDVTAAHNPFFTVGTLELDARALKTGDELSAFTQTASYLAIAPAAYDFTYESDLLVAEPVHVVAGASGHVAAVVDAQPTPAFVDRVQTQLDGFLQNCATQVVLQPTDCPFGIEITDRVVGDANWSIAAMPVVTLAAGETAFEMPQTAGVAHISVDLQSLFDGEFYTEDRDVSFTVALDASVKSDGSISVQLK
ncbi:hypothetical protein ET445_04380 [Agromyces protaetiae]|uniref:Uncharacterized protein n=1 Tax=Agromyces protaetiae TaxID=2509455 RepID=A0A4P6FAK2_9MICO|nr:hypothetical protein [Agromyces protaetiae]QAY72695.1 hypothetical protein ET445_04380 [Agromyces protaetiae]